ncbi:MAG TPA: hypothetical protein VH500_20720 [Nitrososphaeraceae archaeon]|jgi:hypothetical protein
MDITTFLADIGKCDSIELSEREKMVLVKVIKSSYSRKKIFSYFKLKRDKFDFDEGPYLRTLIKKGLVEKKNGNLLSDGISYELTTCCLLYIFLNMQNYSNLLLLKYQENTLLKNLLYSHFDPLSIREYFPLLSVPITQYLRICCRITFNLLKSTKNSNTLLNSENMKTVLECELTWQSKILLLRIVLMASKRDIKPGEDGQVNLNTSSNNIQNLRLINKLLASDQRFLKSFEIVKNEFDDGYKEIVNQSRNYNKLT